VIQIEGLHKTYHSRRRDVVAVDGVDLAVARGEIYGVLGQSGAGKSTLLRCVNLLERPDAGTVVVDGVELTALKEKPLRAARRRVGMVHQHFALLSSRTAAGNVATALSHLPPSERHSRAELLLTRVRLPQHAAKRPHELSGGERQRLALARALARDPSVLLLDEPFAAVDAQTREILQFELLRIWDERPTAMVFVTHSIEEAVLLGHRVIVLKGRPSSIHETITIDLPNPRTRETLREPRFAELREQVWSTLMREAREAEFVLER